MSRIRKFSEGVISDTFNNWRDRLDNIIYKNEDISMKEVEVEFILEDMLDIVNDKKEALYSEDFSKSTPVFDDVILQLEKVNSDIVDNCKRGDGTIGLVYDCLLDSNKSTREKRKYLATLM